MHGYCDKPSCPCREPIKRRARQTYNGMWAVVIVITLVVGLWAAVFKYRDCLKVGHSRVYCALGL